MGRTYILFFWPGYQNFTISVAYAYFCTGFASALVAYPTPRVYP